MIIDAKLVGNVSPDEYHKPQEVPRGDPRFVMSQSELKEFESCPSKWLLATPRKITSAIEWGAQLDCYVLDRSRFDSRYQRLPKMYPAKAKGGMTVDKPWTSKANFCSEYEEEVLAAGRVPVRDRDWEEMLLSFDALKKRADIDFLLMGARTQQCITAVWHDTDLNMKIPVRSLLDIVPVPTHLNWIIDFKQSVSAAPSKWMWMTSDMGYHIQGAFYLDMWNAATPDQPPRTHFGFVVQESEAPYHVERHVLSEDLLMEGRRRYTQAFRQYCECLNSKVWPDYPPANAAAEKVGLWHVTQLHEKMIK